MRTKLLEYYFDIRSAHVRRYGASLVVLMRVGAMFEIMASHASDPTLQLIQRVLNTHIACHATHAICALSESSLPRHIRRLLEHGQTIVIVEQDVEATTRRVSRILSPGCCVDDVYGGGDDDDACRDDKGSAPGGAFNSLAVLFAREGDSSAASDRVTHLCVARLDCATGDVCVDEQSALSDDAPRAARDALDRLGACSELYAYLDVEKPPRWTHAIAQWDMLTGRHVHDHRTQPRHNILDDAFQRHVLSDVYRHVSTPNTDIFSTLDMHTRPLRAALVMLILFARAHDETVVIGLRRPRRWDDGHVVRLVNGVLRHLNIFDAPRGERSVFSHLNGTKTTMGARFLRDALRRPTSDAAHLVARYDRLDAAASLDGADRLAAQALLQCVTDIPRLLRMARKRADLLLRLWTSLTHARTFSRWCVASTTIGPLWSGAVADAINAACDDAERTFDAPAAGATRVHLAPGVDAALDEARARCDALTRTTREWLQRVDDALQQPTSKRHKFAEWSSESATLTIPHTSAQLLARRAPEFTAHPLSRTVDRVRNSDMDVVLDECSRCERLYEVERATRVSARVLDFVARHEEALLERVVPAIGEMDVLLHFGHLSSTRGLTRPTILPTGCDASDEGVQISGSGMRHPIVHELVRAQGGTYVANDVDLTSARPWILYGVNSAGKSSLLKTLTLNALLALCGFYVPCDSLRLTPLRCIAMRIGTSDDMYSGHSSFVREMSELRDILRYADKHALVLTDEMCSSTDHDAAVRVMATLTHQLCARRVCFVVSTHLHDLMANPFVRGLPQLRVLHMHAAFDPDGDIVYERRLVEGPLNVTSYGVDVAARIVDDAPFLHTLRSSFHNVDAIHYEDEGARTSQYNRSFACVSCQVCGHRPRGPEHAALHVHHLAHQASADERGFVTTTHHKNDLHNLCALCHTCHEAVHRGELTNLRYVDTLGGGRKFCWTADGAS